MTTTTGQTRSPRLRAWVPLLVVFVLPFLLRPDDGLAPPQASWGDGHKPAGAAPFDPAPGLTLARDRPVDVFIGNSMLYTRIDPATWEREVGARAQLLAISNTFAPHWYLQLKNHVAASAHRPRTVFVFFQDQQLTEVSLASPAARYALSHEVEPAFAALAHRPCHSLRQRFDATVERVVGAALPLTRRRGAYPLAHVVDAWLGPGFFDGQEPFAFRQQTNALFDLANLRHLVVPFEAGREVAVEDPADFDRLVGCSLLPAMLDVADQAGLSLVFVRIQNRPRAHQPPAQTDNLTRYLGWLSTFVTARGARLIDLRGVIDAPLSMYSYGSHIDEDSTAEYTRRFAQTWRKVF